MENASKALIIAGAIILAILIIGLGMAVFNQAREAITGSNLDSEKAQAFNSKFMDYVGDNVTGIQVKSLLDLIIANNNTSATTENPTITVKNSTALGTGTSVYAVDATGKTTGADIAAKKNKILNTKRYTVTVGSYDTTTGYLVEINLAQK